MRRWAVAVLVVAIASWSCSYTRKVEVEGPRRVPPPSGWSVSGPPQRDGRDWRREKERRREAMQLEQERRREAIRREQEHRREEQMRSERDRDRRDGPGRDRRGEPTEDQDRNSGPQGRDRDRE